MSEKIRYKLNTLEELPPVSAWQSISNELDDINSAALLQHKLEGLTQPVPETAWQNIANSLEQHTDEAAIASTLLMAEVTPPVMAWENIKQSLDETRPAKRFSFGWAKYAAAAAVLIFLGLSGYKYFFSAKKQQAGVAAIPVNKKPLPKSTVPEEVTAVEKSTSQKEDDIRDDEALEKSKKTYARLDVTKRRVDVASDFRFTDYNDVEDAGNDNYNSNLSERYIVLMTPEGNFIRVSKKLGNLVCCVSGEEQDPECREQVEKWRKQIACSGAGHPGNFGDILSLLSSLQND
jgi:hypothetical protein